jgi:lipoprotein-anchoring transpeptidase ErfK/SrfK
MAASQRHFRSAVLFAGLLIVPATPALAQVLAFGPAENDSMSFPQYAPQPGAVSPDSDELPAPLRRQVVAYDSNQPPGTIVIDTAHTFLYLTLGNGKAMRYGIGVGREGFTWSGVQTISRKAEWPDWIPPAEMVARQPYLPRWVGGGPGNPLGARAMYLGNTDYHRQACLEWLYPFAKRRCRGSLRPCRRRCQSRGAAEQRASRVYRRE